MDRREAISRVSMLVGGTIIGADAFLESGCRSKPEDAGALFGRDQLELLNEICETILPETKASPGAKAANVGEFLAIVVNDCYEPEAQEIFINGIKQLERLCRKKYKKGFMKCDPVQREELLIFLDAEQKEYMNGKDDEAPAHYFRMIKELTLPGFFTSGIGATKALRYVAIPGKYVGVVAYQKGDRAWCTFDYFN